MEDQDLAEIDTVISEYDVSLKRLGAVLLEQLFMRNFHVTHRLFQEYMDNLIERKLPPDQNAIFYDNVLSVMGFLPRVYKTLVSKKPELQERYQSQDS